MAMDSSNVDLPDPFSPTKNVTGASNSITGSVLMLGTLNGNAIPRFPGGSASERRWIMTWPRALVPLRNEGAAGLFESNPDDSNASPE